MGQAKNVFSMSNIQFWWLGVGKQNRCGELLFQRRAIVAATLNFPMKGLYIDVPYFCRMRFSDVLRPGVCSALPERPAPAENALRGEFEAMEKVAFVSDITKMNSR